jgi:hypothetical protein
MRTRLLIGMLALGLAALGTHGESRSDERPASAPKRPAAAPQPPAELDALNVASRQMYASARARELAAVPVVIIVSGDDLVLRRNGNRTVATVIPAEYHALKSVAHTTLALFAHLSDEPGRPLGAERVKALKEYQELLAAAGPAVEKCGFDADTLARQKRMLARAEQLTARVLKAGQVSADDLTKYCRASRADLQANGLGAARAQLRGTHKQVMAWKKDMTPAEWAGLTVIVPGTQTPRVEHTAVQYFARLFGETSGESRRVVYAEALFDEEKALNLLGTLRLDGRVGEAVFGDRFRMYRDFLADGARTAIDDIFAPQ